MKLIERLSSFFDRTINIFSVISGVYLVIMTIVIGLSVVTRYFFQTPIGWAQEISEYGLVIITFFSMAWLLKNEGHVTMDLLTNNLKPIVVNWLGTITSAICIVVCFILAYKAFGVAEVEYVNNYRNYTQLAPPKFIFTLVIMLGLILVGIQFIRRTCGFILKLRPGGEKPEGTELERGEAN